MRREAETWVDYIESKHRTRVSSRSGDVDLKPLWATQSEIELIKYRLVRDQGFRRDEPIVVYRGRLGRTYVVDGHTRARVSRDMGEKVISALVYSSPEIQVGLELEGMAARAGGGTARRVRELPITDRLGEGTEAWQQRRRELLGG